MEQHKRQLEGKAGLPAAGSTSHFQQDPLLHILGVLPTSKIPFRKQYIKAITLVLFAKSTCLIKPDTTLKNLKHPLVYPLVVGDCIPSAGTRTPLPEGVSSAQAVLSAGKGTDGAGCAAWTTSKRQQVWAAAELSCGRGAMAEELLQPNLWDAFSPP